VKAYLARKALFLAVSSSRLLVGLDTASAATATVEVRASFVQLVTPNVTASAPGPEEIALHRNESGTPVIIELQEQDGEKRIVAWEAFASDKTAIVSSKESVTVTARFLIPEVKE
jgi:hypothetical protein